MRRVVLLIFIILLSACASKGNEGERCIEGNQCASDALACNLKNRCETCGSQPFQPCCEGGKCQNNELFCDPGGLCQPCGSEGNACCPGQLCNGNMVCGQDNFCQSCGSPEGPCCPGEKCGENLVCGLENYCTMCGFESEACCPGNENQCILSACDNNNLCVVELCDENGKCQSCGNYQESCCAGGSCQSGLLCNPQSTCEYCGELYTPPCQDNKCNGWYIPVDNECRDPFENNPGSDISICQKTEPGYTYYINRDWCIWSAAFYKKDTSICGQLSWDDMVEKCKQGEDPGNYYLTTTYE